MLEDVGNPLGIPFFSLLAPDGLHILRVCEDDVAGGFQNIVNRNPIFPGGFHAHIFAIILGQPGSTAAQISGKGGEPLALVGCHAMLIGRGDAGNNEGLVDIHPTADTVDDFISTDRSRAKIKPTRIWPVRFVFG